MAQLSKTQLPQSIYIPNKSILWLWGSVVTNLDRSADTLGFELIVMPSMGLSYAEIADLNPAIVLY